MLHITTYVYDQMHAGLILSGYLCSLESVLSIVMYVGVQRRKCVLWMLLTLGRVGEHSKVGNANGTMSATIFTLVFKYGCFPRHQITENHQVQKV